MQLNRAQEWTQRAAELDMPLNENGEHTAYRRFRPNTLDH